MHHVLYIQMLAYLKQGELRKLARLGSRGAVVVVYGGQKHLFANNLDIAYAKQAKAMGFASAMTNSDRAEA